MPSKSCPDCCTGAYANDGVGMQMRACLGLRVCVCVCVCVCVQGPAFFRDTPPSFFADSVGWVGGARRAREGEGVR